MWSFAIGPWNPGAVTRELNAGMSRSVNFKLEDPSEASVTIDGFDLAASEIVELSTDMYVYRRPESGGRRQLLYRGRIGKTADSLDENGHTVTVPSVDYRGVLNRRLIMHGNRQTWGNTDQMLIAWQLINNAQGLPGGSLGITNGIGQTSGVTRDREYELGSPVGEKVKELSEVIDGFDWDITATDTNGEQGLQLDRWYPHRGIVKNEVLVYTQSGSNLQSVTRQVDSADYANAVRLVGRAPEGESDGDEPIVERPEPPVTWHDPAPIEGRWDKLYSEDITTVAALEDRADWQLAHAMLIQPSYTVVLKPGFWRGPDHFWLGDTLKLVIQSGRLNVNTDLRVLEIGVVIDEEGDETVTVNLGYPRKDFKKTLSDIDRRLAKLERR